MSAELHSLLGFRAKRSSAGDKELAALARNFLEMERESRRPSSDRSGKITAMPVRRLSVLEGGLGRSSR